MSALLLPKASKYDFFDDICPEIKKDAIVFGPFRSEVGSASGLALIFGHSRDQVCTHIWSLS